MTKPDQIQQLRQAIRNVILGKDDVVEQALTCLLCRGHLLIEDVPGLGKTLLAKTISRSIEAAFRRIQFTPDLLPTDVTGGKIFNQKSADFELRRGPVFTNILLADEINRATPRTQASLLECMAERQVTIDGESHLLPEPFMVIATQNPVDLQGTHFLPEAQLDRFLMKLTIGYLTLDQEIQLLKSPQLDQLDGLQPVVSSAAVLALQEQAAAVHLDDSVLYYIGRLIQSTRQHPAVQLGASPRGTLGLKRAAQAWAMLSGSDFVSPDQVKAMALPVLRHRLLLTPEARLTGQDPDQILGRILDQVEVPIS